MGKNFRRAAVIATGIVTPLMLAVPAHAADFGEPVKDANGQWKAYGSFDDASNTLCVRAYNSVSGAGASIDVYLAGTTTKISPDFFDPGGDEQRTCRTIGYENARVDYVISQLGTGGAVRQQRFAGRVL